jgi:lipopolysaccharide export system protein LptA
MFRTFIKRFLNLFFLVLLSTLIASSSLALPSDSRQALHIKADSSIYNYNTGFNIFEGNVIIDQGTTHITADKLVTKSDLKHKISEAIAYGDQQLAHYWTLSKQSEPEIHAYAKVIKFYPAQSNVTLEKQVKVRQGENSFNGELIHYNSNDQTITVPASNKGRSVIVYNPEN